MSNLFSTNVIKREEGQCFHQIVQDNLDIHLCNYEFLPLHHITLSKAITKWIIRNLNNIKPLGKYRRNS